MNKKEQAREYGVFEDIVQTPLGGIAPIKSEERLYARRLCKKECIIVSSIPPERWEKIRTKMLKDVSDMWDRSTVSIRPKETSSKCHVNVDPDLYRRMKARASEMDVPRWFITELGWELVLDLLHMKK